MSLSLLFWINEWDQIDPMNLMIRNVLGIKTTQEKTFSNQVKNSYHESYPTWLCIKPSIIANAGLGVYTNIPIKSGTKVGYYKGTITKTNPIEKYDPLSDVANYVFLTKKYIFFGETIYVNGYSVSESNWTRYLNCSTNAQNDNIIANDIGYGKIVFYAGRDIDPGEELLFFYGEEYAKSLGINYDPYI
jgi:hypothetical protein